MPKLVTKYIVYIYVLIQFNNHSATVCSEYMLHLLDTFGISLNRICLLKPTELLDLPPANEAAVKACWGWGVVWLVPLNCGTASNSCKIGERSERLEATAANPNLEDEIQRSVRASANGW